MAQLRAVRTPASGWAGHGPDGAVDTPRAVGQEISMPLGDRARDDEQDRARGQAHRALLERIRAGDEVAARELLARYEAQVRLVVRRQLPKLLRSRFDSLDFLQSVWASFFRRMTAGHERFEDPRYL